MESPNPDDPVVRQPSLSQWALPLVLLLTLVNAAVLLVLLRPGGSQPDPTEAGITDGGWRPPPAAGSATVALAIDFGNGARREFAALAWREGMTVGELMRAAREFRPPLAYAVRGQDEMTLLISIDGVANQDAGGRCWLYQVNDRPGEVSFEVQPLAAGDRVLWSFLPPE